MNISSLLSLLECAFFLVRIYQFWDGGVSVQQKARERLQLSRNIMTEGFSELKRLVLLRKPFDIYGAASHFSYNLTLDAPKDPLAWHINAKELLVLRNRRFYFDENGYDDSECCWIGRDNMTNNTVLIRCSHNDPGNNEVNRFIKYASKIASQNNELLSQAELIWASKVGVGESIKYNGLEIQKETEESLFEDLVDFTDYYFEIKRRVETENLPNSKLTLKDVYVPSNFRLEKSDKSGEKNVEEFISDWLIEPGGKQLALLGEYGQGKSTCSLMVSYHLIKNSNNNPPRIPILIQLRGISPRRMTPEDLLATWAHPYDINPNALMKLWIAGKLLLILEGFDEVDLRGGSEMRLAHFRQLWKFSYPKAKVIFTGRPNFFLDDSEMKAALGIRDFSIEKPFCQALSLELFDLDKMRRALRFLDQSVIDEICGLAEKDERFMELASRPSLLFLIGILWEKENLSKYKDMINSAFVMDRYIRYSLQRQEGKVREGIRYMVLNSPEREYFMKGLAVYMVSENLPDQINSHQFDNIVSKLFVQMPDSVSSTNAASGEDSGPLRIRKKDDEHLIEHIKTDVRTCGLLVSNLSSSGSLKFPHKSFIEFLCADFWARKILNNKQNVAEKEISASILSASDAKVADILGHQEIISFIAEIVSMRVLRMEGHDSYDKALFIFETIMNIRSRFPLIRRMRLVGDGMLPYFGGLLIFFFILTITSFTIDIGNLTDSQKISALFSAQLVAWGFTFGASDKIRSAFMGNQILIKLFFLCCKSLNISEKTIGRVIGVRDVNRWKDRSLEIFKKWEQVIANRKPRGKPRGQVDRTLIEVLGSRKNILFCEGEKSSDDYKLYSLLFPEYTIKPVGGHLDVINYTRAFNKSKEIFGNCALGIIDGDFHSEDEKAKWEADSVYCIDAQEVENLLCDEVLLIAGKEEFYSDDRALETAKEELFKTLERQKETQAVAYATQKINNALKSNLLKKPKTKAELKKQFKNTIENIDIDALVNERTQLFEKIISDGDYISGVKYCNNKGLIGIVGNKIVSDYKYRMLRLLESKESDSLGPKLLAELRKKYFSKIPRSECEEIHE